MSTVAGRFDQFWQAYPRRVGKLAAWRVWQRLKPDEDLTTAMIAAVERQQQSRQWRSDGGQYIPHPRTWLSQGRWMDEAESAGEVLEATPAEAEEFERYYRQRLGQYCRHAPACEDRETCKARQRQEWLQARRGR